MTFYDDLDEATKLEDRCDMCWGFGVKQGKPCESCGGLGSITTDFGDKIIAFLVERGFVRNRRGDDT